MFFVPLDIKSTL